MQQVLFAMLTDDRARSNKVIEEIVDRELSIGIPWFDKILVA